MATGVGRGAGSSAAAHPGATVSRRLTAALLAAAAVLANLAFTALGTIFNYPEVLILAAVLLVRRPRANRDAGPQPPPDRTGPQNDPRGGSSASPKRLSHLGNGHIFRPRHTGVVLVLSLQDEHLPTMARHRT